MVSRPPLRLEGNEVVAAFDSEAISGPGSEFVQPWLSWWDRGTVPADLNRLTAVVSYTEKSTDCLAFIISDQNNGQDIESSFAMQQALVVAYNGVKDGRLPFDEVSHREASQLSCPAWERIDDGVVLGAPVPGWKRTWGAYVIRFFEHPRVLTSIVRERIHDHDPSPALVDLGDAASRLPLRNPKAPPPPNLA